MSAFFARAPPEANISSFGHRTAHGIRGRFRLIDRAVITALRQRARKDEIYRKYASLQVKTELPAIDLAASDLARHVQESLARLTPQHQLIYQLSREEGLRLEEIAERLGLSKKTVSNTLSIIVAEIRSYLAAHKGQLEVWIIVFGLLKK